MATFIDGVNRLLRINRIIKGDDDAITAFTDTQHSADINLAQIAIQSELSSLASERLFPYEKTSSTITLLTSTRTYSLASDFVRFYGDNPSFYDSTNNIRYYEYPGGENSLKDQIYDYKTNESSPIAWYWENTTSKKVSFFAVPDASYNNRSLSYDYEKDISVTNSTDTLPFHSTIESNAFIECAARRFKFLTEGTELGSMEQDPTYANAKTTLLRLIRPTNPPNRYGYHYG